MLGFRKSVPSIPWALIFSLNDFCSEGIKIHLSAHNVADFQRCAEVIIEVGSLSDFVDEFLRLILSWLPLWRQKSQSALLTVLKGWNFDSLGN